MRRSLAVVLTIVTVQSLVAQEPKSKDLPLVPTRTLAVDTDEGSWISVDISPDGRTVVFDLLGDLYTVPIGGGAAVPITGGAGGR